MEFWVYLRALGRGIDEKTHLFSGITLAEEMREVCSYKASLFTSGWEKTPKCNDTMSKHSTVSFHHSFHSWAYSGFCRLISKPAVEAAICSPQPD